MAAKFVARVEVCTGLREAVATDPNFLPKIVTGHEMRAYGYDLESSNHHMEDAKTLF